MTPPEEVHQRLEKGEKFFQKENFLLAKREFEFVYSKDPHVEIREKIIACTEKIAEQERKSAVSRGKKHMKAGKLPKALACFEKAYAIRKEPEVFEQITAIKEKLQKKTFLEEIAQAEKKGVNECLAVCNSYLEKGSDHEIIKKKGIFLVKNSQFYEAIDLFSELQRLDDIAKYFSGFAHAQVGRYIPALTLWFSISGPNSKLVHEQAKKLFPFMLKDFRETEEIENNSLGVLQKICCDFPEQKTLDPFRLIYIRWLWMHEKYLDIVHFLHPLPNEIPPSLINLFAQVYYKLACNSIEFLEKAITFWFTAVYNIVDEDLRSVLLDRMESLYHKHMRSSVSNIPPQIRYNWEKERNIIKKLHRLGLRNTPDEIRLCTPSFALTFGLSTNVAEFLEQRRTDHQLSEFEYYEVAAYFSSAAASMILSGSGEHAQALAAFPSSGEDPITVYCRQKISFRFAISDINKTPTRAIKALNRAMPLINKHAQYRQELIDLIYSEKGEKAAPMLADVMEKICRSNKGQKFSEAAAFCLCLKAMELTKSLSYNYTHIENILRRALAIDPNCQMAKTGLTQSKDNIYVTQLYKALDKLNLSKAISIVRRSNSHFVEEAFFENVEELYDEIDNDNTVSEEEKLVLLKHLHANCSQLDPEHPLVLEIGSAIGERAAR